MNPLELGTAAQAYRAVQQHLRRAAGAYSYAWECHLLAQEALQQATQVLEAAAARGELPEPVARCVSAFARCQAGSQVLAVAMGQEARQALVAEARAMEATARAALEVAHTLGRQGGGEA